MALPALAAAGGSLLSSAIGYHGQKKTNQLNQEMSREAMRFNAAEAQKSRDFEAEMSNTGHQRAVADLKAAGLNPLLAANDSASTPSGATASGSPGAAAQNPSSDLIGPAIASAMESRKLELAAQANAADKELKGKQGDVADAQARNLDMDTKVKSKDLPKAEILNKAYKIGEQVFDKVSGALQTNPQSRSNSEKAKQRFMRHVIP